MLTNLKPAAIRKWSNKVGTSQTKDSALQPTSTIPTKRKFAIFEGDSSASSTSKVEKDSTLQVKAKPISTKTLKRKYASKGEEYFHIVSYDGKGSGLQAVTDISAGTRILTEKPIFTTSALFLIPPHYHPELHIKNEVEHLPRKSSYNEMERLSKAIGSPTLSWAEKVAMVVKNNGIPLLAFRKPKSGDIGCDEIGVFKVMRLVNHSCDPNCQQSWNESLGEEALHVVRDIKEGEELTISYLKERTDAGNVAPEELEYGFGFTCVCSQHIEGSSEYALSRMDEIQDLREYWATKLDSRSWIPLSCLLEMRHIFKRNNVTDCRLGRLFEDCIFTVVRHGDKARAATFARRACSVYRKCEGADSTNTKRVMAIADDPTTHMWWNGDKHRTRKSRIPRGVSSKDFETWLWRVEDEVNNSDHPHRNIKE